MDGEIHATATLDLDITDATDDGRYTLAELNNGSEVTFGLTPSGTFEAVLPLDIQIAGATFTNPQISLQSANIFTQLPTVDTTTANFDKLFNMGKVGPEAILDLIIAVGDWASNFRDSNVFDFNIPFLNADLGNAFDFGLLLHEKSARQAAERSQLRRARRRLRVVHARGGRAARHRQRRLHRAHRARRAAAYATKAAFITALNTALGASSKFEAEAHGDNGVRIAAKDANAVSNFSVMGATHQLKTIGFVASSTVVTSEVTLPLAAPANGKITANAQFQVSIDGATPVDDHGHEDFHRQQHDRSPNLAADIDAALEPAHGHRRDGAGDKIKLTRADGKSFMVVGVSGTTFQQIGLENASAAGLADLGSTLAERAELQDAHRHGAVPPRRTRHRRRRRRRRATIRSARATTSRRRSFIPALRARVPRAFDHAAGRVRVRARWLRPKLRTVDASGNPANATLTFTPTLGGSFDFGISLADDSVVRGTRRSPRPPASRRRATRRRRTVRRTRTTRSRGTASSAATRSSRFPSTTASSTR